MVTTRAPCGSRVVIVLNQLVRDFYLESRFARATGARREVRGGVSFSHEESHANLCFNLTFSKVEALVHFGTVPLNPISLEEKIMKRKKTLVLVCLVLCALGSAVSWNSFGRAEAAKANTPRRLAIEISMGQPFTVPAATPGHILETFLRVPANANGVQTIAAVKLAPKMVADKMEVTVSTITGDTSLIKTCKDWDLLKESRVASYTLKEGEQITVSQLSNLGPNFKNGTVTFKAVLFSPSPDFEEVVGDDCGCGRCGDMYCCPNRGYCIGCATCGDVCCRKGNSE